MKKINISFLFPLFTLILLLYALSHQLFNISPVGKLLDPFEGAVQNDAEQALTNPTLTIDDLALKAPVQVLFDDRKVPHIFAKNNDDLYFAQGYVTAYLRLWQMDFLSYVAAGRLSEIMSFDGVLDYDRNQRRIGILDAAETSLALIEKDPETVKVLNAYTLGVNAFIKQLQYKNMPFEYKLLDYTPEPWTNLKSVLILKQMGNTLSGYEEDIFMSKMMLTLGEEKFNKFFPDFHDHISPVIDQEFQVPNKALAHVTEPTYLGSSFICANQTVSKSDYNPKLGSNSWAVSGAKTSTGYPILCNDPHLNLSLPSVWVEMQLSSPEQNVYGVSIPGTPAIIIGFNQQIAWGITNGADDVKDWYKLKISKDYKKYEFDGSWHDLKSEIVQINQRDHSPFYDTIYHTIQGPIVVNKSFQGKHPELTDLALKWELHNPSNEFLTFIKLNKATNYEAFKDAIKHYNCPTQNFTYADKNNNIAMHHQGRMAIKWPGQGKFILDGSNKDHLTSNYIPEDSLPQVYNPLCNFVLSANQHPTTIGYKYYYNGYYSDPRANCIKQLLESENKFDFKKMEAMQMSNANLLASDFSVLLLKNMDRSKLNPQQLKILSDIADWKGIYSLDNEKATFFQLWWDDVKKNTWDEWRKLSFYVRPPEDYLLVDFIAKEPNNECFDEQGTMKKENAVDIITESFYTAFESYERFKTEQGVKWGECNKVNIVHLTNLDAFSRMDIPSAGNPDAINAIDNTWGPSWRMIVELGERPKAYGVYCGGQSGAIGSPYYDSFINDWSKGSYYPLQFFISEQEASVAASNRWTLK
jgi:penicillin amidase